MGGCLERPGVPAGSWAASAGAPFLVRHAVLRTRTRQRAGITQDRHWHFPGLIATPRAQCRSSAAPDVRHSNRGVRRVRGSWRAAGTLPARIGGMSVAENDPAPRNRGSACERQRHRVPGLVVTDEVRKLRFHRRHAGCVTAPSAQVAGGAAATGNFPRRIATLRPQCWGSAVPDERHPNRGDRRVRGLARLRNTSGADWRDGGAGK